MPVITRIGAFWAVGSVTLLLLALLLRSHVALTMASASLLGLVLDAVLTFPLGRRARLAGLELSWWISGAEERPPAVVSAKIPIEGHLRMHTDAHLPLLSIAPVVDDALDVEMVQMPRELEGGAASRFRLLVRPRSVGRHVLQGLSTLVTGPFGAFAVGLYFPHPLEVRALPRALATRAVRAEAGGHERLEGSSRRSHAGSGADLHELRAHRPGDSLKQVAWKASARRGRLLVREVEHEVQETHWLLLDLGSSMFAGAPGARRIDRAIEQASSDAQRLLDEDHRVGLVTFDTRVIEVSRPGDGKRKRIELLEKLTAAVHVYDVSRVDADERALAAFVAAHLREHEARFHPVSSERERALLASTLAPQLRDTRGDAHPDVARGPDTPASVFLAYCRERGLRVPPRAIAPDGSRTEALANAVSRVLEGGPPSGLHLYSDLDEIGADGKAAALLRVAGARGRLRLNIPEATEPPEADALTRALGIAFRRAESQKNRRLVRALERPASPKWKAP